MTRIEYNAPLAQLNIELGALKRHQIFALLLKHLLALRPKPLSDAHQLSAHLRRDVGLPPINSPPTDLLRHL